MYFKAANKIGANYYAIMYHKPSHSHVDRTPYKSGFYKYTLGFITYILFFSKCLDGTLAQVFWTIVIWASTYMLLHALCTVVGSTGQGITTLYPGMHKIPFRNPSEAHSFRKIFIISSALSII